jgi:hypothetical protein
MVAGFGLGDTFGRSLGARIRAAHAALWLVIIALSAALSWSISAGVDVLFGRDHTPLAPVAFIVGAIVGAAGVRAQRRKRDADSKQDSERSMKSVAMVAAFIKRQNAG